MFVFYFNRLSFSVNLILISGSTLTLTWRQGAWWRDRPVSPGPCRGQRLPALPARGIAAVAGDLLYLEMGMGLADIAWAVAGGAGRVARLRRHRGVLLDRADGLAAMLATPEAAISDLEGGQMMADKALYAGITSQKQREYEGWLAQRGLADALALAQAGPVDAGPADWPMVEAPLVVLFAAGLGRAFLAARVQSGGLRGIGRDLWPPGFRFTL